MKLYWSQSSLPALQGLSSDQKKAATKAVVRDVWKHWQVWLPIALQFISFLLLLRYLPAGSNRFFISVVFISITSRFAALPFHFYLQEHLARKEQESFQY